MISTNARIRIDIGRLDPDPGQKRPTKILKSFLMLDVLL
jgi:hypothetical protein